MNTKTKEVKITSNSLKKRRNARKNSLYLTWEDKPILTEYQFARALGYKPIWERGTNQNIIWKKGGKDNNRLSPIFLLSKILGSLPQKFLDYLYRKIGENSYYQERGIRKHSIITIFQQYIESIRIYSFMRICDVDRYSYFKYQIPPILLSAFLLLFLLSLFLTTLLLSQKTHAYVDIEVMGQDQSWLLTLIIPAIFLFWVVIYILRFISSYKKRRCYEGKLSGSYKHIYNSHSNWLLTRIRKILFYTVIVPIFFIGRIIKRAFVHNEGFMNIFLRSYIFNPFHNWLLLNWLYDRLSSKNSFTHSLVVAKTWLGKTSTYIIPNLLTLDNCSILTVDLSWELYAKTSWAMRQKGYDIKIINPTNLAISERYNPLEFVKDKKDILEIAHILVFSQGGVQWDNFWNNWAMKLIEILISCLISQREKLRESGLNDYSKYCTLSQLRYLLNNFWEAGKWLDEFVCTYADYETYHDWKGFISWYEETTQGFVINALTSLNIIGNKEVAILTARNGIDFKKIRERKTVYYFQVPWHLIHIYAPLISIFYTQFFSSCMEQLPNKKDLDVYALIDEAGHIKIGSSEFFSTMITNIRKYRVSISLIVQNLSQMETLYWSVGANTITHWGIATQIYFWGCDVNTCEMIEKLLGNIISRETDWLWRMVYTKEPLRSIFQIRTMLDNEAILLYSNKKPVTLYMKPYYKHSILRNLSEIEPVKVERSNKEDILPYLDLKNIDACLDVENVEEKNKLEIAEDEIDELSNPDFSLQEMPQAKFQEYMEIDDSPLFDIRCLYEETRTVIELIKEKVIYCHLTESFDDMSDEFRFFIKKRVKKLMDLPDYFERLNFIRNSVCGRCSAIINPPKVERASFDSYSDLCNYRAENPEVGKSSNSSDSVSMSNISWSYTKMCNNRFNPYEWIEDIDIIPWEGYSSYCDRTRNLDS